MFRKCIFEVSVFQCGKAAVSLVLVVLTIAEPDLAVAQLDENLQVEQVERAPVSVTMLAVPASVENGRVGVGSWMGFDADSYRWGHARGRAFLSTVGPLVASGIFLRIGDSVHNDAWGPTHTAGVCVAGAGLLVGSSMGQWCVGDSRRAWLGTSIRGGGILGMIAGVRLAVEQTEDDGLGAILAAPVKIVAYSLPGFFVMMFGVGWSLDRTPDRFCGTESEKVALRPAAIAMPGGRVASGLSLRLRF